VAWSPHESLTGSPSYSMGSSPIPFSPLLIPRSGMRFVVRSGGWSARPVCAGRSPAHTQFLSLKAGAASSSGVGISIGSWDERRTSSNGANLTTFGNIVSRRTIPRARTSPNTRYLATFAPVSVAVTGVSRLSLLLSVLRRRETPPLACWVAATKSGELPGWLGAFLRPPARQPRGEKQSIVQAGSLWAAGVDSLSTAQRFPATVQWRIF